MATTAGLELASRRDAELLQQVLPDGETELIGDIVRQNTVEHVTMASP